MNFLEDSEPQPRSVLGFRYHEENQNGMNNNESPIVSIRHGRNTEAWPTTTFEQTPWKLMSQQMSWFHTQAGELCSMLHWLKVFLEGAYARHLGALIAYIRQGDWSHHSYESSSWHMDTSWNIYFFVFKLRFCTLNDSCACVGAGNGICLPSCSSPNFMNFPAPKWELSPSPSQTIWCY